MTQTSLLGDVGVHWRSASIDEANGALVAWGHKMGPMERPDFDDQTAQGLYHEGRLVAVTIVTSLVRGTVEGCPWISRANTVELTRLCAERSGLCRVALRLWREFTFPGIPAPIAISYQDADLHSGNTYRFDGWERVARARSHGVDPRSGRVGRDKWVWQWPRGARGGA